MSQVMQEAETKVQRVERLKQEKNPWEAFDEIRAFARQDRAHIAPEWASTYFKWWGIISQGDGTGVLGGKDGEGRASDYFMMRVGVPNGMLTAVQLRTIGGLARKYARNFADISGRQAIQLRWLTLESLPEVVDTLDSAGLTPRSSSGDAAANVTGCPLAGVAADELIDASPLAREIAEMLQGNPDFYNLPRKLKISVTGCPSWCSDPEINDIGLTATRHEGEIGYSIRVGGGLSKEPHFGKHLDAFILPNQAARVVRAVAEIFRDQQGLRVNRKCARMKYLFLKGGWTAESFLTELQSRLEFKLLPGGPEQFPADVVRDHVGIHPQHQLGFSSVGATVLCGRMTADQMEAAADLAERFGNGALRTTVSQNLLFIDIPNHSTAEFAHHLNRIGLPVEGSSFWRGAVSCTGSEFCKLALTETKGFTRWLMDELEERLPEFDQQLRLSVTGCPNGCARHWIADIGLEGKKIKHQGELTDAYYFCVGGSVGEHAAFSRRVGYRCPASQVPEVIVRLLQQYLATRNHQENLRLWFSRHSDHELRTWLAGEVVDAIEHDAPSGHLPQCVAD
jgi:sulfite reductase (ferredoxin)